MMLSWERLSRFIPTVTKPVQKLTFRQKITWTFFIIVLFYVLGSITAYGIDQAAVSQFEFLEIVFGSSFGSLITLGIGPIVTASIILQLFVGSKIINWDTNTEEGKNKIHTAATLVIVAFCIIEAIAYVVANAVPPASPELAGIVIAQLTIGGIIIIFMDEVCSKWGLGSGVSLFIAAGVAKTIFVRIFNPLTQAGALPTASEPASGIIPLFITSIAQGMPSFISLLPLLATAIVFIITIYIQGVKIELPMSFSLPFGKFGSRRWPLKFLYTSNIPVILTAAVVANIQVVGKMLYESGITLLGTYNDQGSPVSGLMYYLSNPAGNTGLIVVTLLASIFAILFILVNNRTFRKHTLKISLIGAAIGAVLGMVMIPVFGLSAITFDDFLHTLAYVSVFVIGSTIFSMFWVNTAGMDSKSIADQFRAQSIMLPGFRHDPRIIEKVLDRYIPVLTILGGATVGFIASFADLTSAIGSGTGILLTVMIIYQFYEQITQQHYEEIPERIRKFLGI